ncbi:MAG: radical SAM protein, partial [Lachnospiraceae bacterium]|nr:radical SAM protein [Lachnospiraceae bacterium]
LLHTNGSGLMRPRGSMKHFVPAGQSTQMIIGATPESDLQILSVTESLYQKFELKRVFYSSFINVNQDPDMPEWQGRTLLDREHRLYQADFLLRFYHFQVDELLTPDRPNFNMLVDPKCDYALRHLELFPVEINRASYDMLLKVPGIGVKSALRILKARQTCVLDFADLKKIGVVMKRAVYFITCRGRMLYPIRMTEDNLTSYLIDDDKRKALQGDRIEYKQLSLFDLSNDFRKAAAI